MNKKSNEKGYGAYEFLTVAVVCLMLSAILLVVILRNVQQEKLQVFYYNAKIMAINAINSDMGSSNSTVYLYDMLNNDAISEMKNPFSDGVCDPYDSKIVFTADSKSVTLKCGSYLVEQENLSSSTYTIYRVTEWQDTKCSDKNIETKKVYNFYNSNKLALDDYYEEKLFITKVNEKLNTRFSSIKEIQQKHKIVSKTVYRKKVVVKEVEKKEEV